MKKAFLIAAIVVSLLAAMVKLARLRTGLVIPASASDVEEATSLPTLADATTKSSIEYRGKLRLAGMQESGSVTLLVCLLRCQSCHDLKGGKEKAGPSLAQVADRLSREEIIDQLLDPDKRAAKRGMIMIEFRNGRSEELRLIKDNSDTLQVCDRAGKIRAIAKEEIEGYAPVRSSMPSGLVDDLTPQQFRDLMAFLMTRK